MLFKFHAVAYGDENRAAHFTVRARSDDDAIAHAMREARAGAHPKVFLETEAGIVVFDGPTIPPATKPTPKARRHQRRAMRSRVRMLLADAALWDAGAGDDLPSMLEIAEACGFTSLRQAAIHAAREG